MEKRQKLALVPDCGMNLRTGTPRATLDRINVRPKVMAADSGSGLDGKGQSRAGLPPVGGDLPQIPGVRIELLGEPLPAGHVGDVGGEVHTPPTIANCYPKVNSNARADKSSRLLHHPFVGRISEIEQLRRTNLARLREEIGPAELERKTGLSVAHLYQMSLGKDDNARNVNDQHARLIEQKAGKPEGWLDTPENQPLPRDSRSAHEWPFPDFTFAEWMSLDNQLRDALIAAATTVVVQARANNKKQRQKPR
jgi:hypothetical protein